MPGILFREINDKNLLFVPEDFFAGKGIAGKSFQEAYNTQLLSAYIREILSLIVAENSLCRPVIILLISSGKLKK